MNKLNKKNIVYTDLIKNGLIKNKNLKVISNTTRNAKIRVLKDTEKQIIFLEKISISDNYYKNKYKSKLKKGRFISETKFLSGKKVTNKRLNDDLRRVRELKKFIINKNVCDFGCGFGGFLISSKKIADKLTGIELGKNCRDYLTKNNIRNFSDISKCDDKFDLITMFHTLHYIPHQVQTLKILKNKLSQNGKIVIEVPNAEDFLLGEDLIPEFKKFTFCKESLIWHTETSLKKFLKVAGFKKVKIKLIQRYGLNNHLGWFLYRKPGGHNYFKKKLGHNLKENYKKFLIKNKITDTLFAIASK